MTYDETEGARVPLKRAMREIMAHGSEAFISGHIVDGKRIPTHLVEFDTEEKIAAVGRDGCVNGRDILDWLGY